MKRIIIYLTIAFLSFFCFAKAQAQGVTMFGISNPARTTDTSKTWGQLVVPYLATSDSNKVLGVTATGHFVLRNDDGGSVDTSVIATKNYVNNGLDSINRRQNKILGTLYNASSWADLSDFDTSFGGVSIVGNKINITGGTRDSATVLSWYHTTCLTSWSIASRFIVEEKSATSYGIAHGIKGKDEYTADGNTGWSTFATVDLTTHGTQGGKIYILSGGNSSITARDSSTAKLTFSAGDTIVLNTKWEYTIYTVSATNITTGSKVQHTYNFGTNVRYNTGKFSIWSRGGNVTLDSLNISSEAVKDIDLLFIGDSKSSCVNATSISKCWARIVQMHYPNSNIHAGVGDRVNDVMDALPEIRSLNPKQALINLYYNDLWNAPAANMIAEYPVMIDSLEAMGIVTYKMTPQDYPSGSFPTIQQRYDSFRTWLYDTYDSSEIIDPFYQMQKCGGACNFFSAHPNDTGYAVIANVVINSQKLTGATEMHELIQRIIGDTAQVLRAELNTTPTLQQVTTAGNTTTTSVTVAGLTSNGLSTFNSASTAGTQTAATFLHPGTSVGDNVRVELAPRNNSTLGGNIVAGNLGSNENYIAIEVEPSNTELMRIRNTTSYKGVTTGIDPSQSIVVNSQMAIGSHVAIYGAATTDVTDTFMIWGRRDNGTSRYHMGLYRLSSTLANNNITFAIHNGVGAHTHVNAFSITGTGIETEQPTASGAGRVRFGKVLTGSDTNKYWEVEIDGVDYYIRALTSLP